MKQDNDQLAVEAAERAIQRILLDLSEQLAERIDSVEVDTRNFAAYRTEIALHRREEWPSVMDGAATPFADNH